MLQQRTEVESKIYVIDTTTSNLSRQLSALRAESDKETTDVVVTVKANQAVANAQFEITYYVKQAGWFANYDLRVINVQQPMDLVMKANVYQSSGEDWNKVKLLISNGNPAESGVVPILFPWYLNFNSNNKSYVGYSGITGNTITGRVVGDGDVLPGASVMVKGTSIGTVTDFDGNFAIKVPNPNSTLVVSYVGFKQKEIKPKSDYVSVNLELDGVLDEVAVKGYILKEKSNYDKISIRGISSTLKGEVSGVNIAQAPEVSINYQPTTMNYEIEELFTIKNDGKTYTAEIQRKEIPATYQYVSVPKIESGAFLKAKVADWQDLNLLDGEINLFFEDSYQGKSLLDLSNAVDTLEISLGKDKGIIVERKPIKELTSTRFLSNNKTVSQAFEITVRNNKPYPVNVLIYDQLPISQNKELVVEREEYIGAKLNKDTQILTWQLDFRPRTEQKVQLKYQLKYPKNKRLILD